MKINHVIPAEAGIQHRFAMRGLKGRWMPAFAGMTLFFCCLSLVTSAAELKVDRAACDYLVAYKQPPGVNYEPGVDVEGRSVAPADLNPSPLNKNLQDQIAIKLSNDAAQVFGMGAAIPQIPQPGPSDETPTTVPAANMEMDIGYITFNHGEPYLNGKPLNNDQQNALAVLCSQQKNR